MYSIQKGGIPMLQLVFSDSACGSLKVAYGYGIGKYPGGATAVFYSNADGSPVSPAELEAARQEAERRMRSEWENAVPMEGSPRDAFTLSQGLSFGDISEEFPGPLRLGALKLLFGAYPEGDEAATDLFDTFHANWTAVLARLRQGECARIWYSDNPDELCGFFWLLTRLRAEGIPASQLVTVKIPAEEVCGNETRRHLSCGDLSPGEWGRFLVSEQPVSETQMADCAACWTKLRQENTILRIVRDGRPISTSEDHYDRWILQEIESAEPEFMEARVIGNVLGRYRLGIGDTFVHRRIEQFIRDGLLEPITEAPQDGPAYHRRLRKRVDSV